MSNIILTVAHHIFLTKEQRDNLYKGEQIDVVGVSMPVWFKDNVSSEPANEIFCKYNLKPTEFIIHINHNEEGYEIQIPKKSYNPKTGKDNPVTVKNILDIKNGGCEWLAFRQFNVVKKNKKDKIGRAHV